MGRSQGGATFENPIASAFEDETASPTAPDSERRSVSPTARLQSSPKIAQKAKGNKKERRASVLPTADTFDAELGSPEPEPESEGAGSDGAGASSPADKPQGLRLSRASAPLSSQDSSQGSENDVERGPVEIDPTDKATTAQIVQLFKEFDLDGNGTIDREEMQLMLERLHKASDPDSVDMMMREFWIAGGVKGELENHEATLEEFISWWHTTGKYEHAALLKPVHGFRRAGSGTKRIGQKLFSPANKLKQLVQDEPETASKSVAPESLFVIDKSGNDDNRESTEIAAQVHNAFERDFHHLEDVFMGQEGAAHWRVAWEEAAASHFNENMVLNDLGWSAPVAAAGRVVFEASERLSLWRCFLQSNPLGPKHEKLSKFSQLNRRLAKKLNKDADQPPVPTKAVVLRAAEKFLADNSDEIVLDAEDIPFDTAMSAIKVSMQKESAFRSNKVTALTKRMKGAKGVPRKILVAGLRGDSAAANGIYCADGLRAFWGRPLYVQIPSTGASIVHYCYYDMRHDPAGDGEEWIDGSWIIGPSLNSDRCTAYVVEVEDKQDHRWPPSSAELENKDDLGKWHVFDTLSKNWAAAPSTHCPAFDVKVIRKGGQTMGEYVSRAIEHETTMMKQAQQAVVHCDTAGSEFHERVKLTLGGHRNEKGFVSRSNFLNWRSQYYNDELNHATASLRKQILSRARELGLSSDPDERRDTVDEILSDFSWVCARKIQNRRLEKRKFVTRIERPAMSRAFFSWKFLWRSSTTQLVSSGGTFAEPTLPWNVRHPRGSFTTVWETVQAALLIYVSFAVIYRVSFNAPGTGFLGLFETMIDFYFALDILFNFHTAFYDRSGDLQGVHPAGKARGMWGFLALGTSANLPVLYSHYLRGWFVIDVLSVFPFDKLQTFIYGFMTNDQESEPGRAVKILRLLRLAKLLRLLRAMSILKKHEDKVGPLISGCLLIGAVLLLIHGMTCWWYFVGTLGATEVIANGTTPVPGAVSTGWVERVFQGSDRLCACWTTPGSKDGLTAPLHFFFDAFERKCIHPSLDRGHDEYFKPICPGNRQPTMWDYYTKALFTALQDNTIDYGYSHSIWELFSAALITAVMGFMWGAVAGVWSSIFQANQMAGQAYNMKMAHLKEFCRVKELDWPTRAKLVAYYEHLYPERVIVNESEIIDELPPGMRMDLVRKIYGPVIASVPLFFGLSRSILTEICMALTPLPSLKGQVLLMEGEVGTEMYCISDGSCRVTQHMRGGDDEERVRVWVEEVFAAHYSMVKLYEPNQKVLLEKLLKRMATLARSSESMSPRSPRSMKTPNSVTYRELLTDEKTMTMLESQRALMEANTTLNTLLELAKEQNRVRYSGALRIRQGGNRSGPVITLVDKKEWATIRYDSSLALLCKAFKDGVLLCRMMNFFLINKIDIWTEGGLYGTASSITADAVDIAGGIASGTTSTAMSGAVKAAAAVPDAMGSKKLMKATNTVDEMQQKASAAMLQSVDRESGARKNIEAFLDVLTDPDRMFNTGDLIVNAMADGGDAGQHLFTVDDLLNYDKGTMQEQEQKQKKVLACVLELAIVVSSLEGYMGVRIDEVNLGTLKSGEFFGELSLLPLAGGWRSLRTITAVQNSMLYYITKAKMEWLSSVYNDLKHKLHDHAEDYEKLLLKNTAEHLSGGRSAVDQENKTHSSVDQDPLAEVKEQLTQQNAKMMQQDLKLSQLDATMHKLLDLCESIQAQLPQKK